MLSSRFQWLLAEGGPRMLLKGLELYGVTEVVGAKHNPIILGWAHEVGLEKIYVADEVPWCGLLHLVCAVRAQKAIPFTPREALWALNWLKFGTIPGLKSADGSISITQQILSAELGDTLVFRRPEGGHVAQYIGEDNDYFFTLGGNQGNAVSIVRIAKERCVGVRRPPYINKPANIRKIFLTSIGVPTTQNEA